MEKNWRLREKICLVVCMLLLGGSLLVSAELMTPIQERIIAVAERYRFTVELAR